MRARVRHSLRASLRVFAEARAGFWKRNIAEFQVDSSEPPLPPRRWSAHLLLLGRGFFFPELSYLAGFGQSGTQSVGCSGLGE